MPKQRQAAGAADVDNWLEDIKHLRAQVQGGPIPVQHLAALMLPTVENAGVVSLFQLDPDWRLPPLWRSEFRHVLLKVVDAALQARSAGVGIGSGAPVTKGPVSALRWSSQGSSSQPRRARSRSIKAWGSS